MYAKAELTAPAEVDITVTAQMNVAQWQIVLRHLKWDGPSNTLRDAVEGALQELQQRVEGTLAKLAEAEEKELV